MVGRRARHALLAIIAGVWTIQFFAVLFANRTPDPTVNAAFLLVAGAVFGVEAVRRGKGNGEDT